QVLRVPAPAGDARPAPPPLPPGTRAAPPPPPQPGPVGAKAPPGRGGPSPRLVAGGVAGVAFAVAALLGAAYYFSERPPERGPELAVRPDAGEAKTPDRPAPRPAEKPTPKPEKLPPPAPEPPADRRPPTADHP